MSAALLLSSRPMRFVGLPSLALVLVAACGGPSFDGQVFRNGDLTFRVGPVPASWRSIEATGALLAYRDDEAAATVALNGRCGLDGDDVPLEALTHHLFLQFTGRELVSQERVDLDGRAALRTEMLAELDGVKKRYVVYVLKKDGCVYDFLYVSPGRAGGKEAFERFVRGFGTLT
jgi:hypothetical protein